MEKRIREFIKSTIQFLRKSISGKNEDLPYYLLIIVSLIVVVFGINFFVELTEGLKGAPLRNFDKTVTDYVLSFRTPERTRFFQIITDVGDFYGYLIATALATAYFFWKFRNWKIILQILSVTVLAALSNLVLKRFINRARPEIEHLVVVETLSYPSGHSMSAMAFYGFLIYLSFRIKMSNILRVFLCILFSFLIISIGISRIYLGVHFPSDVVGGFAAGFIWVAFCILLFNTIDLLRRRKSRRPSESEENLEQ